MHESNVKKMNNVFHINLIYIEASFIKYHTHTHTKQTQKKIIYLFFMKRN